MTFFTPTLLSQRVTLIRGMLMDGALKVKISQIVWQLQSARIYSTVNLLNEGFVHHRKGNAIVGTGDQKNNKNNTARDPFNFQQIVIFQNDDSC